MKRRVQAAYGVSAIVHFGEKWPTIPDEVIEEIRAGLGGGEVATPEEEVRPGEEIIISGGLFHAVRAMVTYVFPARERLRVLFNFLGQMVTLEIGTGSVVRDYPQLLALGQVA